MLLSSCNVDILTNR